MVEMGGQALESKRLTYAWRMHHLFEHNSTRLRRFADILEMVRSPVPYHPGPLSLFIFLHVRPSPWASPSPVPFARRRPPLGLSLTCPPPLRRP